MAAGPHISLSAETIFTLAGFPVTNSIFTSVVLSGVLIGSAAYIRTQLKNTNNPTGLQNVVETVIEGLYNLVYSVTQSHSKAKTFFPVIASFFFFILINNWMSIVPGMGTIGVLHETTEKHAEATEFLPKTQVSAAGSETTAVEEAAVLDSDGEIIGPEESYKSGGEYEFIPIIRPGSADLNTTLALGITSVFLTQIIGFKFLGFSYFKKFINFSSPIMFIVGILELNSEFAKIVSFAFRLFGNIFAGEVLLTVIAFIGGTFLFFAPMPFYGLEIFVGLIQAVVFAMLTLVFFNMATVSHDH